MMVTRQKELFIISALVCALIAQIAALLWHMDLLPGISSPQDNSNRTRAGHVVELQKKLKRRSPHSLVWENSQTQQDFYYHDSLLTLKESQAVIELANETRLSIGENTLISIEPFDETEQQDIKIRFQRGRLLARNPYQESHISEGDLEMRVEKNSEIEISKGENSQAEVDVKKGRVQIKSQQRELTLEENQWLSLSDPEATPKKVSQELVWQAPPPKRHYIRDPKLEVTLQWHGEAHSLSLRKSQGESQLLPIANQQKSQQLELKHGEYQLRLIGEHEVSPALWLQVRPAPTLHLLNPEPRNRLSYGGENFLWTPLSEAASYQVVLKQGSKVFKQKQVDENSAELDLNQDLDLHWEVWAQDKEGFPIPPAYDYPLYIRENPLAPPKLKQPLRLPATPKPPTTSWLNLLIPQAWADTQGALLSWDPVPGADHYILEVSNRKDFRNLLLSKKLNNTQFVYVNLEKTQTLYWRVAAGSKQQMGIFSSSAPLSWQDLKDLPQDVASNHPLTSPEESQDSQTQPPAKAKTKKESQPKEVPTKKTATDKKSEPLSRHRRLRAFWAPSYLIRDLRRQGPTQANTLGEELVSFILQWDLNLSQQQELQIHTHFSLAHYEPTEPQSRPFQDSVASHFASLRVLTRSKESPWIWGLHASLHPQVQRVQTEKVDFENHLNYGMQGGLQWQGASLEYLGLIGLFNSGLGAGANSLHRLSYQMSPFYVLGIEYEVFIFDGDILGSLSHRGSLLFGFEF